MTHCLLRDERLSFDKKNSCSFKTMQQAEVFCCLASLTFKERSVMTLLSVQIKIDELFEAVVSNSVSCLLGLEASLFYNKILHVFLDVFCSKSMVSYFLLFFLYTSLN